MSALVTIHFSSPITSVTFAGKKVTSSPSSVTVSANASVSAITVTSGWSGTVYWDTSSSMPDPYVLANVSNGVASIVSNNLTYTGKNRDIYLSASGSTPSYSTNLIYFRTGTGVSSYTVTYANSSSTGNTASVTGRNSSTSIYVRASTNAQVTHINYESGYGGPLQFVEYTDSTFSTVKKYFDQGDLYVYSSGTRYVKLFATRNQIRCYYYANGGTFSGGSNLYTDSVDAGEYSYTSAPSNAVSRSGYELVGWATDSSATTAGWGTNDSIGPLSGNISVYAVWRKIRFTITFYANGGSWSSGSDPYTESVESGSYASTETPSGRVYRSGYRLLGWSTSSTATSATYSTNEAIGPLGASISLYAVWEENPYITLDAGEGRFGTDRYVYFHIDYGGHVYFSNYNPTRAGYTLIGWSATSGATSPTYGPTDYVGPLYGSSYKFYAVWQQSTATITLNGNGGKWDDATGIIQLTRNVGDVLNFGSYSSLTRAGYTLLGWSANSTATSATYGVNGTVDVGASDATYYAVWQKITIDLFYWNSASTDASLIAAGQPISNMTAARWNRFKAKIAELAEAEGGSYSYSTVASGNTFYATEFNSVRTAIMNRSGYGTLPAAQSSGDAVKAALFEGSGSLKTALNAAITHYNNS